MYGQGSPSSELADAAHEIHKEYSSLSDIMRRRNVLHEVNAHGSRLPSRAESTILGWLKGSAVSPSEYEVFLGLGVATKNEIFFKWYEDAKNDPYDVNSFYGSYKTWLIVRQQIMKYLNGSKGSGQNGHSKDLSKEEPVVGIKPEIDVVVSEFIDRVDEDVLSAKILEIKPLSSNSQQRKTASRKPEFGLSRGAYTGSPREGMNMKNAMDASTDFEIIKEAYKGIVTEWTLRVVESQDPEDADVKEFVRLADQDFFLRRYGDRAYGFLV